MRVKVVRGCSGHRILVDGREQRAGIREQGADIIKQRAKSKEQGQRAESRKQVGSLFMDSGFVAQASREEEVG
jgi:hypothetical protein